MSPLLGPSPADPASSWPTSRPRALDSKRAQIVMDLLRRLPELGDEECHVAGRARIDGPDHQTRCALRAPQVGGRAGKVAAMQPSAVESGSW